MTIKRICWDCPDAPVREWRVVSEGNGREGHLFKISCPACKKDILQRKMSRFAMLKGGKSPEGEGMDDLPIDESKMESAMESLMSEAEGIDENDPKAAARLMRKLSEKTGLQYNESIENALTRLESGDDPEAIALNPQTLEPGQDTTVLTTLRALLVTTPETPVARREEPAVQPASA